MNYYYTLAVGNEHSDEKGGDCGERERGGGCWRERRGGGREG